MTTDTEFAATEERLGRTLTTMARTIPDEPPPFRPEVAVVVDHRRPGHRARVVAAAVAVAAAAAGIVVVSTGDDATNPSIRLGGDRVAPAASVPDRAADGLVAVPNVVGRPLDEALQLLDQAGFGANPQGAPRDSSTAVVITQSPTGRVQPGTTIDLTVTPG